MKSLLAIALLAVAVSSPAASAPPARTADETALLAVDARQRDAVAKADLDAIASLSHPDLHVNAPTNRILTRDDLIAMVGSGRIRNEVFERTPELVRITGDVGMVMGHETVLPGKASEQADKFGVKLLKRRYTNIYLRSGGVWRHWARHANVAPE